MGASRFDRLTRTLGSRCTAPGGLPSGLTLLPIEKAARRRRKSKGNGKQRVNAQRNPELKHLW